jgi:anti-sigma regulatory factor (Ser/Thr protein kinase)
VDDGMDDRVIDAVAASERFVAEQAAEDRRSLSQASTKQPARVRPQSTRPGPFAQKLPAPAGRVLEHSFASEQLGMLRRVLSAWAGEQRLAAAPTEELVLAVNELATNSIRYGGGRGKLLLWRERDALVCEIQDDGHIEDPLIGRSPPAPNQHTGRGLWLVHQLCDLVQIHSSPAGTAVRVRKAAAGESAA